MSVIRDGFTATFNCVDPTRADYNPQQPPPAADATIMVNWTPCLGANVVVMSETCVQGAPHYDYEGSVCGNDNTDTEAYCTYGFGPNTCAYCSEYVDDWGWDELDPWSMAPQIEPDVFTPDLGGSDFGGVDDLDIHLMLGLVGQTCPDEYRACEMDLTHTPTCMEEIMTLLGHSLEPSPSSLAGALSGCMDVAMEAGNPTLMANMTHIVCGTDQCCRCQMGCGEDSSCSMNCFETGNACYDTVGGSMGGDVYSGPCDSCLMGCDGAVDWDSVDLETADWENDATLTAMFDVYELCTGQCYATGGACGTLGSLGPDLHPCDACMIGCTAGQDPDWMGEVAIGRPFLVGGMEAGQKRERVLLAEAVEAGGDCTDWIGNL